MASQSRRIPEDDERVDLSPLLRLAGWGLAASAALAVAVLAAQSEFGERRVAMAAAPVSAQTEAARAATAQALSRAAEAEREAYRLAETVKTLAADRDKLTARIAVLESSIEDLTGSISLTQPVRRPPAGVAPELLGLSAAPAPTALLAPASRPAIESEVRQAADPRALPPIEPAPTQLATAAITTDGLLDGVVGRDPNEIPVPRPNPLPASARAGTDMAVAQTAVLTATAPAASPPAVSTPVTTGTGASAGGNRYGIELGGPAGLDGLRALWAKVREGEGAAILSDLKPGIALREAGKPGLMEMRLVAGPVASTLVASRLCASVAATSGVACRAATLDGQTLALP